ncbi:prepilin-type N-terminal cleavage/methylation domain-containing protein [Geoalkalibacter sp.]|uniref:prepilin-type N-terminal cleavage/methylation domain-containing protein n=1 Tax=Geoalkalibacter sp. TaxID=3041440 RepID=UPI00272EA570|nr:prepilin-type N-terminal cleavage/methylation domain-containing protein [Geoalkalibacter sp.]
MKQTSPARHATRRGAGFTLVEVLLALALTGLASTALFGLYRTHLDAHEINRRLLEDQSRLRAALGVITGQLRGAGYDPTGQADAGIRSAREGYVYLTRDLNGEGGAGSAPDGRLSAPGEHLAFCRYGTGTLGMHSGSRDGGSCSGSGAGAAGHPGGGFHQPLAEQVETLRFRYFALDETGASVELLPDPLSGEVANPRDIRQIEVSLTTAWSYKGQTRRRTLRETVLLRNPPP